MSNRSLRRGIPLSAVLALTAACSSHPPIPAVYGTISGTVVYGEQTALPDDAVVDVTLEDVSSLQVPPVVVAETTVLAGGLPVPLPFDLRYPTADIRSGHHYAVRAVVRSGGSPVLTTMPPAPVLMPDAPDSLELSLVRVEGPTEPADADQPTENPLWGTAWRLEDLAGRGVSGRVEAILEFPGPGQVAGIGSCNRFFGSVAIDAGAMSFAGLESTEMACPDEVMDQENRYLAALRDVVQYTLQDDTLLLYTRNDDAPLRFERAGS